jgi:hypothetical protein
VNVCEGDSTFCRVLHTADPWCTECSDDARAANFKGAAGRTSVANQEVCPSRLVMAAFYGSGRRLEPPRPAYMAFRTSEVEANGGRLEKSDAEPPWPPEYNDAHHEIAEGEDSVAQFMARAFAQDGTRMVLVDREELFSEMCALLTRPNPHEQRCSEDNGAARAGRHRLRVVVASPAKSQARRLRARGSDEHTLQRHRRSLSAAFLVCCPSRAAVVGATRVQVAVARAGLRAARAAVPALEWPLEVARPARAWAELPRTRALQAWRPRLAPHIARSISSPASRRRGVSP